MKFHDEILSARQRTVLKRLGPVATLNNFYLGGGTALALHLGHRRSQDFDWFTGQSLADPMALAQELRDVGLRFSTERIAPGTLHGSIAGIRITFLEYRYRLLAPLLPWADYGCELAAKNDLPRRVAHTLPATLSS